MMMARSGPERLIMGALMFDAARDMVLASLPKDLPEDELKRRLFERIYGEPMEKFLGNRPAVTEGSVAGKTPTKR